MTRRKLWLLAALVVSITALVFLASSLAELQFGSGEPFSFGGMMPALPTAAGGGVAMPPWMQVILRIGSLIILALLPFSLIYLIISPEARRRFLQNLILFGVILLAVYFLRRQLQTAEPKELALNLSAVARGEPGETPPAAQFNATPPQWLIILTSFLAAAVLTAFGGLVAWAMLRSRRKRKPAIAFAELAQEAQQALDTLAAGGDLRNTVLHCYREMSRVVRESRGIQRQGAMTPREFEEQLAHAGLPAEPVHDLTRLFEEVRYGSKELSPWEERRAVASLSAIADACQHLS